MKIAVFGATGRTGRPLIEQALEAGHTVTAFARDPSRLPVQHERLTVAQGDIADAETVARAIAGQDAAICVLGQAPGSRRDLLTVAAQSIVAGMQRHGVRRLLTLVGAGVSDPRDEPPPAPARVMIGLLKLLAPNVLADAERHAETVRASGLDWTIVRVPRLSDDPPRGSVHLGYERPGFAPLARADVAAVLLRLAADGTYLREAPILSAPR